MAILWATLPALCCCGPDPHYLQQDETEHSFVPIEYVYIHSDDTPLEYCLVLYYHYFPDCREKMVPMILKSNNIVLNCCREPK